MSDDTGLVLIDHKSHSAFKNKAERTEYFRQLNLYAECIKRKYGEYPYKLVFNMFRVPKMEAEIFAPSQSKDDMIWFQNSVKKILENKNWDCKVDEWYCSNLCGMGCIYGDI